MESRLLPAQQLDVLADPDNFIVNAGQGRSRSFQPGEEFSRTDRFGTSEVVSGWQNQAFVVREESLDGPGSFTERYEVDAAGRLVCTRALKIPGVAKATVKSVYLRLPDTAMQVEAAQRSRRGTLPLAQPGRPGPRDFNSRLSPLW